MRAETHISAFRNILGSQSLFLSVGAGLKSHSRYSTIDPAAANFLSTFVP